MGFGRSFGALSKSFEGSAGPQYRRDMPALIAPTTRLHTAWLQAHAEWGPGPHEDGFGLRPSDKVDAPAGFADWVARLTAESNEASGAPCTYRWIVEGDSVLGGIALRHEFDEHVRWAGHIGFGIRPSARGHGYAGWALGRMLGEAAELGMNRVLIVCAVDNIASAGTIERHGGVLEGIRETPLGPARRYWISVE